MRRANEIYCNRCGKRIEEKAGNAFEKALHVEKTWGYFSEKDGETHVFDLCEECYDEILKTFTIPAEVSEQDILI